MENAELTKTANDYAFESEIFCPYCKANATEHWSKLNFWKCSSCRLIFRYPLPEENSVVELYETSWTSPSENKSETGATSLDLARIYARKLANSLNRKDFNGLRILDFGAGRGDAMTALSELGADMYGVEPYGYDEVVEKGFKMFRTLDEIPEGFTFDGVITMDVVEHLEFPWEEMEGLKRLLNEDGFIFLSTPNVGSLRAKIKGERWREALRPGHFVLFDPNTLENMLKRLGYKDMKRLRWYLNYKDNKVHNLLGYILQTVGIDGELRYLVKKS